MMRDFDNLPSKGPSPHPTMPNIQVNSNGIKKLLKGLNIHKATGPDAIPTRFLHDYAEELAPIMTFIFQLSLDTGNIPDDWREANSNGRNGPLSGCEGHVPVFYKIRT
jgi:hypothetical protein